MVTGSYDYLVYLLTSPSGKTYVGITCNFERRILNHTRYKGCKAIHAAIVKYGIDNIEKMILESNLTLEEAKQREIFYIKLLNSLYPNGYNLDSGGGGSGIPSQLTRERMSKSSKGHKRNIGIVLSEQAKRNMSLASIGKPGTTNGRPMSISAKMAISNAMKGNKHCVGRVASEETRQKHRESALRQHAKRKLSP